MNPNNVLAHYNLGLVYTGLSNQDQAMGEYRAAVALNPKYASAYYAMALLYQSQSNAVEATDAFQKYLALDPTGSYSENARASLGKIQQTMGANPAGAAGGISGAANVPGTGAATDQMQMPPKGPSFNSAGISEADANASGQIRKPL
jgi:tetratricopeptide (TPR) repeat protein